jgi:hypothetical protein
VQFVPVASFASSIFSSKDHPTLIIALQLVDLLLTKILALYKPTFRCEGVFHEITAPTIPRFKKLSSLSLEPEDAIMLRPPHPGANSGGGFLFAFFFWEEGGRWLQARTCGCERLRSRKSKHRSSAPPIGARWELS